MDQLAYEMLAVLSATYLSHCHTLYQIAAQKEFCDESVTLVRKNKGSDIVVVILMHNLENLAHREPV